MSRTELESLACQLEGLTTVKTWWCVGPDRECIEMWFDHTNSIDPRTAAFLWLHDQNEHNPNGRYRDYIVFKSEHYSDKDKRIREIAQQLRGMAGDDDPHPAHNAQRS